MNYVIKSREGFVIGEAKTETEAWNKAIDAWKGIPTSNRPKFRAQAFHAMVANGYISSKKEDAR